MHEATTRKNGGLQAGPVPVPVRTQIEISAAICDLCPPTCFLPNLGHDPHPAEMKYALPDSACPVPAWQRTPARRTFEPVGALKPTFAIRGHAVDLVDEREEPEDEEASK